MRSALSKGVLDSPIVDERRRITDAWIALFRQIGAEVPALLYMTHAQRTDGSTKGADPGPGSHPEGTLAYETDTDKIFRNEYMPPSGGAEAFAQWVELGLDQTPWTSDIDGAGFNLSNVNQIDANAYLVAGLQVVGARLAAIAFPTVSATTVTQFAGATYTSNEQAMLTSLKTSVNQLNSDIVNLQTAVNDIRNRLFTHGLTY